MPADHTGPPSDGYPPAPWRLRGEAWAGLFRTDQPVPLPPGLAPLLGRRWLVVVLARYQAGSLSYDEVLLGPPVRHGPRPGVLIQHIWVNDAASRAGGRHIWGLPKALASFTWQDEAVHITDEHGPIATLGLSQPAARLPWLWLPAPGFGQRDGRVTYFVGRLSARLGRGGLRIRAWSDRLPARPATRPVLSLAARPLRLTVPPPRML